MPDHDELAAPMEMSCEMSPERFGGRMGDAAFEAVRAEKERLRNAIEDALLSLRVGHDAEARDILEAALSGRSAPEDDR
jgi:hypothetical protein